MTGSRGRCIDIDHRSQVLECHVFPVDGRLHRDGLSHNVKVSIAGRQDNLVRIVLDRDGGRIIDRSAIHDLVIVLKGKGECRGILVKIAPDVSDDQLPILRKQSHLIGRVPFSDSVGSVERQPRLRGESGLQRNRIGFGLRRFYDSDFACLGQGLLRTGRQQQGCGEVKDSFHSLLLIFRPIDQHPDCRALLSQHPFAYHRGDLPPTSVPAVRFPEPRTCASVSFS